MPISVKDSAFVVNSTQSISLASMFGETPSSSNPTYLVLTGLDRNEYTVGATGATGTLSGNGATDTFSSIGDDGRGIDIVFTYQASTGQYNNSTYATLNQVTYAASASSNDVTNLSLFGTNSLSVANSYGNNAYSMIQHDAAGYIGSVTVATQPSFQGSVPAQATPNSIAAAAESFVGKAWNMDGCWVLASTIAAEAGASLPVASTLIGVPGQSNGEWLVAYDGPAGQSGNWQSMVKAGEMIAFETSSGGGHITTCVSGSGSTAMLVDNVTYVNANGQVTNLANDGSSADVTIAAPHAASQEWAGAPASMVVIYELDTPIVSDLVMSDALMFRGSQTLSTLFSAVDPAGKAVTEYQVYDTATSDSLFVSGATESAHSAATAVTTSSLSSVSLVGGSTATTDMVEVRAFNGSYWGDWQTLNVTVSANTNPTIVTPPPAAPTNSANAVNDSISDLYIGYFDRAPDPAGETYWVGQLQGGMSLSQIAQSFSVQTEPTSQYAFLASPNTSSATAVQTFVSAIYNNLFNRAPDAAGEAYWVAQLQTGASTVSGVILNIINGVQGSDGLTLANKVTVGDYYDTQISNNNVQFSVASAQAALSAVTSNVSSIATAEALVDAYVKTAPPAATTASQTEVSLVGISAGNDLTHIA